MKKARKNSPMHAPTHNTPLVAPAAPSVPRFSHDWLRLKGRVVLDPIARMLARTGVTPNMLTVLGYLFNLVVALALALGSLRLGGVLLILASLFDALDGTLARLTHRQSSFGAFFDSTVDRYSEATVYGGILFYFMNQSMQGETLVVYAAIIGSLMVSYSRARAEGLDVDCKVGLLTRVERMLILCAGLILNWLVPAMWMVAILANLTALQRMRHVHRVIREQEQTLDD